MSEIKPALSANEWVSGTGGDDCWGYRNGRVWLFGSSPWEEFGVEEHDRHAVAALCLHGQPYGFTWEDVDLLREISMEPGVAWFDTVEDRPVPEPTLKSIADRIAALLPPRQSA